jgi:phosphomannomutase
VLIATHSGLRGRPGSELTDEVVAQAVGSLVAVLRGAGLAMRVAVARDDRHTSGPMAELITQALLARGTDSIELGPISTPGAKVAALRAGAGAAAIVTGSHLAEELNGLKFVAGPRLLPLDFRRLPPPVATGTGRGRRKSETGGEEMHAEALRAALDVTAIRAAGPRVRVQGGVGGGASRIVGSLGCSVSEGEADVTLVLDADADRVSLADEREDALDSELTLQLAVRSRRPALVVRSADTSRAVDDLQGATGGRVEVVTPGELHLAERLADEGDALAGEGNGGVIVPDVGPGRDGLAAGALALELAAKTGRSLSELAADLPRYERRRSSVPCAGEAEATRRLAAAARALGEAPPTDPELGLSVDRGDAWGLLRRSATEPVLRVTAEARRVEGAEALHDELAAALGA